MKNIPLCLCLLLLSAALPAQNHFIGIKAGVSIPNLTAGGSTENPINTGYSSRLGPDIAVFVEWGLTKNLSLLPTLQYSAQGGKKNGYQAFTTPSAYIPFFPAGQAPPYLYANYRSEAKMNYLMLVVPVKWTWPLGKGPYLLSADAGPFVSFLLNAQQETSGSSIIYADGQQQQPLTPSPQSFDHEQNIKDDLHKANAGVEADLGLARVLKKGRIFLESGFNYGFINIQRDEVNGKNRTGAAIFRLGYAFRLNGP